MEQQNVAQARGERFGAQEAGSVSRSIGSSRATIGRGGFAVLGRSDVAVDELTEFFDRFHEGLAVVFGPVVRLVTPGWTPRVAAMVRVQGGGLSGIAQQAASGTREPEEHLDTVREDIDRMPYPLLDPIALVNLGVMGKEQAERLRPA
jgi:hypothetical protein